MKMQDEEQIYEDISRFIQIFKRSLTYLELIIQNAKKNDQMKVYIQKQKNSLTEMLQLAQKYSQQPESLNIDQNTYLRFCNRLIETISLIKTQQIHVNNHDFMHYFTQNLKKLEKAVKNNQQEKKFKQLIGDTYWLFLNVCSKLEAHLLTEQTMSVSKSCQKMKQKGLEVIMNRKIKYLKKDEDSIFAKIKNDSVQKIMKNESRPQITKINKTVGNINARFDSLKCLDIDYQYFKSSTFQAIQKCALFEKQYLSRNEESVKLVKRYQDDFQLFLKKKQLKVNRKNKRIILETQYDSLGSVNSVMQEIKQNKSYIKMMRNKMNQTMNERSIIDKLNKSKDEQVDKNTQLKKILTHQSNKTLYSVKNNFLIFGKKQNKNADKLGKKDEKKSEKKVLQTHSINLSIFRDDSYQNAHWQSQKPLKQQKTVKNQLDSPIMLKFQQQIFQTTKQESEKEQKDSCLLSPNKKILKSKEVQLNLGKTLTQTSQPQSIIFKERILKYRSKIEPKLRNIIFRSKQI